MQIILYNGEALKKYRAGKRKKRWLIVLGVILSLLLVCACALSTLGNWSNIKAFFVKEEEHVHSWRVATLKNASCAEDGLVLCVCEECKEEEKSFLSAYGHSLTENVCTECGEKASEGLKFTFEAEGKDAFAVITGIGECTDRDVIIPNRIGGLPVKKIAENAFKDNLNIYSVSIPEGVKKIGSGAFERCKNLYTILLPEGVEELSVGAFNYTAYYNDVANWNENDQLYRQGYLLEQIDEATTN